MNKLYIISVLASLLGSSLAGCSAPQPKQMSEQAKSHHYQIKMSEQVIVTSEQGHQMSVVENILFQEGAPSGEVVIEVQPDKKKQTMHGIGTSFTESSAFVLAHLSTEKRQQVMENIYGRAGANFPLARTHIGSTDFTVEGKYSYAAEPDDRQLNAFSIAPDMAGFDPERYRGIVDSGFDLLPMIQQANTIKQRQGQADVNIVASAWTAPPWMKDTEQWFIRGSAQTNYEGTGGSLKPQYEELYADYLLKYLDAYQSKGVKIWGLTPVNEPHGNSGQWESMHFTAQTQRDFIKRYLGPKLKNSQHSDVRLLAYDQNRDGLEHWADTILGDEQSAQYVAGTAVHWYESTYKVYEHALQAVHDKYPQHDIIHTEGTIDDLGKPAPQGVADPSGFEESNWFNNDSFWWNANATDWAYTALWAPNPQDHPKYTPVHRYARNIIVSFNHWMSGWIDWNIVLDHKGGPNHVGNFCGAPIMINTGSGEVYYTPIYYVLAQLSRTIRPGDVAVQVDLQRANLHEDVLHASATINAKNLLSLQLLNTSKQALQFDLKIGAQHAKVHMPANAVQTIQVQL